MALTGAAYEGDPLHSHPCGDVWSDGLSRQPGQAGSVGRACGKFICAGTGQRQGYREVAQCHDGQEHGYPERALGLDAGGVIHDGVITSSHARDYGAAKGGDAGNHSAGSTPHRALKSVPDGGA